MTDNKDPQITAEIVQGWKELEILEGNSYSSWKMKILVDAFLEQAAELKQLRAERQWQDISTAPKDGTKILAYLIDNAEHRKSFPENERNGIDIIVWTNHNKGGWISNRFGTPTDWMPLPDKLTDSAQRGEGE